MESEVEVEVEKLTVSTWKAFSLIFITTQVGCAREEMTPRRAVFVIIWIGRIRPVALERLPSRRRQLIGSRSE